MAKDLKNTIQVDGNTYNINAVHSDAATKVDNSLIIRQSAEDKQDIIFDGRAVDDNGNPIKREFSIVPSTGGTFSGAIKITDNQINRDEPDQVLTYSNVNELIENLTGFSCYLWNFDEEIGIGVLSGAFDGDNLVKASLITGTESHLSFFVSEYIKEPTYYLYLCSDTGNIFLVVCFINENDEQETLCKQLGIKANQLVYKTETDNIIYSAKNIQTKFNELTSKLDLNQDNALKAKFDEVINLIKLIISGKNAVFDGKEFYSLTELDGAINDISGSISKIVTGMISVEKAKHAENSDTAANAAKLGDKLPDFYQKKITISDRTPKDGAKIDGGDGDNGDIWITYSNKAQ